MSTLVLITVGTSALENNGGANRSRDGAVERHTSACDSAKCRALNGRVDSAEVAQSLLHLFLAGHGYATQGSLGYEIGWRFGLHGAGTDVRDILPQELSYLALLAGFEPSTGKWSEDPGPYRVVLLASDSPDGQVCAQVVHAVLTGGSAEPRDLWALFSQVEIVTVPGLQVQEKEKFEREGVPNLQKAIAEKVNEHAGCTRVLVNFTGGFKGAIPFTALGALFLPKDRQVSLHYLFHDTPHILELPLYPIGVDFQLWHNQALLLRAATVPAGERYYKDALDPRMAAVAAGLRSSPADHTLPVLLKAQYEDQLSEDPLKVYSKGVVGRILDPAGPGFAGGLAAGMPWDTAEAKALRDVLHDLLDKSGDIIWLGDKIPEMVDHSNRHHHDLLELTELFLAPMLQVAPGFLNACERFVLLSAVLLHDCGHALDRISLAACTALESLFGSVTVRGLPDELRLFPDDVRDYHQYLSPIRLDDAQFAEDLGWPRRDGLEARGLPPLLHEAVLLACLYHRRRMDFDDGDGSKGRLHLTGQNPGTLAAQVKRHVELSRHVDLRKIVLLLRIIDGCDSQVRRAGPDKRVDLTLRLLDRDADTAMRVAREHYDLYCSRFGAPHGIIDHAGRLELDDPDRMHRIECLKQRHAAPAASDRQCAWLLLAEAVNRATVRYRQEKHYLKHRLVARVSVAPDGAFGADTLHFHVHLEAPPPAATFRDPDTGDTRETAEMLDAPYDKTGTTWRKTVLDEISSEYEAVAKAAEPYRLRVDYAWSQAEAALP